MSAGPPLRKVEAPSTVVPKPKLKVWTAQDIWAPLPPPEYAIGGLLLRGSLAMICATGSSLKTWMAVALVLAVAGKTRWLARFDVDAPGGALFVDWESGDYELRRRIQAISPMPVAGVELVTMPDLFFNSSDFEAEVTELARTRALIAFDSLAAGSVDLDENDARFAKGLQILKRVGALTNCAMVVLHHSRKGKPDGGGDARERPRGTGAIYAACDVVLQLDKQKDGSFLVEQTKARGGKEVPSFVVRVDDLEEGGVSVYATDKRETLDAETPVEDLVARGAEDLARARKGVLLLLAKDRAVPNPSAVAGRLKGSPGHRGIQRAAAFAALKELKAQGLIVDHEGSLRLASEVTR